MVERTLFKIAFSMIFSNWTIESLLKICLLKMDWSLLFPERNSFHDNCFRECIRCENLLRRQKVAIHLILSLFNILRYAITKKSGFNHRTNHISPSPNWPEYQPPDLSISTSAPLSEDATGAMDFNLWTEIGTDFLIKSNINNWISCSEDGGSFVKHTEGGLGL